MAWITDSLRSAIERLSPRGRDGLLPTVFHHQLAIVAYMSSGMLRKVISIPADDRVREWRDWQAEEEDIGKIEAEERRLGLQAKTKAAEVLRGIGGGALLLITPGDHASELKPEEIAEGGLVAINVVSRWQIHCTDWVEDLADPLYGTPRWFEINSGTRRQRIHPSRMVCFRGDPIPAGHSVSKDDAFWGDSRLMRVFREVERSDETQGWFAALVKKAKLLRVGIPNLTDLVSTTPGQKQLDSRIALISEGESTLNAVVYDAGNGTEGAGEKIDDYQITWAGIPAVMDAFDQRVAAVADIPFTRLMGRSPAGMNATGDHDTDNWNKMVVSGQTIELRPCLAQIDPILIRSAGVDPVKGRKRKKGKEEIVDAVTWRFAPLDTPTEKEQADTFKTTMDAIKILIDSGTVPDIAMSKGVQNLMSEREWIPGLDQALAELPEDERFPEGPTEEEIRAEEQARAALAKGGDPASAGGGGQPPVARAANDAAPRTLYVQRKLLNGAEFIAWAKGQGFETVTPADELHVTIISSRTPVDWMKMGSPYDGNDKGELVIPPGGARIVEPLGDKGAIVLLFNSSSLSWRHEEMVRAGASYDFPEYQPHVTITYTAPEGVDLSKVEPFRGALRFGPEVFDKTTEGWRPSEA